MSWSRLGLGKIWEGLVSNKISNVSVSSRSRKKRSRLHPCFQRFLDSAQIGLEVFNDPLFSVSLRLIAMQLFSALCSSAASERVFSQAGLMMRPARSRLSKSRLSQLVFLKCNEQNVLD